jgi:hypothetical protein
MRTRLALFLVMIHMLAPPVYAEVPTRAVADQAVRKKCGADFPDDFSTQRYCITNGIKGYDKFVALKAKSQPVMMLAFDKCQSDFGSTGDWSTAAYCAGNQIKGYDEFQVLKSSATPELARSYRQCETDFASQGDWSTTAYCAKNQRKAYDELKR